MNQTDYDVVILGVGPAGLSAALWCDDLGLSACLIESRPEIGGQLRRIFNPISNHLGATAANGSEMLEIFLRQVSERRFDLITGAGNSVIDPAGFRVSIGGGRKIGGRAFIIATGVRRRRLGVRGEREFEGRGIIESGKKNADASRGKSVVIVGGGDAALENALILSEAARSVTVVHRRPEFTAREQFIGQARASAGIELVPGAVVDSIEGDDRVRSVNIRYAADGRSAELAADIVLIRIGVEPNTEGFSSFLATGPGGYLTVDAEGRTSLEGFYAAGDVANPASPTVSTAVGMGATAAKAILSWLSR